MTKPKSTSQPDKLDLPRVRITLEVAVPYGYRVVNERIEIDPVQAAHVRELFRQYLNGEL